MFMNRVAITGVGAISCLGCGPDHIAENLRLGRSGVVLDPRRVELGFRSALTGDIKGFDPTAYLGRKQRKTMTLFAIQSYAAVMQAIEQSGLDPKSFQNEQSGLIFGCDSSCLAAWEQASKTQEAGDTTTLGSGYVFQSMISNITMNLNVLLKTQGACWTISSACSSSGHAIGQSADLIRTGKQDRVICGGAQEINWQSMCSFDSLGAFSTRQESPQEASRPFSKDRDGLVPSGGAAAIVLENYAMAQERGATIFGEICGYGFSSDGSRISVPDCKGLRRSMEMAITEARVDTKNIDYICAHSTSTLAGDPVEARAIHAVFGDIKPPVSALKGMTGHELWMAGAGQVVYTTLMAMHGFTAANINLSSVDDVCGQLNLITETLNQPPHLALCNSAGFGGSNASLLIQYEV
jgi:3-oxoacyl-[acyl-carrier-protein] synthase-1